MYFIGLETGSNRSSAEALFTYFNGSLPQGGLPRNQFVTLNEHFHFLWLNTYDTAPTALLPLLAEVTGRQYEAAEQDAEGNFVVSPYAALTQSTSLLLSGTFSSAGLQLTDGEGTPLLYTMEQPANSALSFLQVAGSHATIHIPAVPGLKAVYSWSDESSSLLPTLSLKNSDGRTTFQRNEEGNFFVTLEGSQGDLLAQDMVAHGDICQLLDASGSVMAELTYDAAGKSFQGSCVFTHSGDEIPLQACIQLGNRPALYSEPLIISVTNTAPTVTSSGSAMYWIHDPWSEDGDDVLRIPFTATDAEGDTLFPELVSESTVEGLGTVSLSEDGQQVEIALNRDPKQATTFNIQLVVSDGEALSDTCLISFELYDLTASVEMLKDAFHLSPAVSDALYKKTATPFVVTVDYSVQMPSFLREALEQELAHHLQWKLLSRNNDDGTTLPVIPMTFENGQWQGSLQAEKAGAYTITANCDTQAIGLVLEDSTLSLDILNHAPAPLVEGSTLSLAEALMEEDATGTEVYILKDFVPSALFTDEDGDEITATLTATLTTEEETISLTATAVEDEPIPPLSITVPGTYEVTVVPQDEDGQGEGLQFTVVAVSARAKLIRQILLLAAAVAALMLLLALLVYAIKPGFKGKVLTLTLRSPQWEGKGRIHLDAWKKKKQPLHALLTCTACPPDSELFAAFAACRCKPRRNGVTLLNTGNLEVGSKKIVLRDGEPVTLQVGSYTMEWKVTLEEPVPKAGK